MEELGGEKLTKMEISYFQDDIWEISKWKLAKLQIKLLIICEILKCPI